MIQKTRKALLLDRDGTIIVDRDYLGDPAGVEILPGAGAALRKAREAGFLLVVVSNQSGVGRGFFPESAVDAVNARMAEYLAREGVEIDGFYHCPHTPEDGCGCRKPATGMVERAVSELGIDITSSFVVGDKASDVQLGRRAGAGTVLVRTGKKGEDDPRGAVDADFQVGTLAEAVEWIINEAQHHG